MGAGSSRQSDDERSHRTNSTQKKHLRKYRNVRPASTKNRISSESGSTKSKTHDSATSKIKTHDSATSKKYDRVNNVYTKRPTTKKSTVKRVVSTRIRRPLEKSDSGRGSGSGTGSTSEPDEKQTLSPGKSGTDLKVIRKSKPRVAATSIDRLSQRHICNGNCSCSSDNDSLDSCPVCCSSKGNSSSSPTTIEKPKKSIRYTSKEDLLNPVHTHKVQVHKGTVSPGKKEENNIRDKSKENPSSNSREKVNTSYCVMEDIIKEKSKEKEAAKPSSDQKPDLPEKLRDKKPVRISPSLPVASSHNHSVKGDSHRGGSTKETRTEVKIEPKKVVDKRVSANQPLVESNTISSSPPLSKNSEEFKELTSPVSNSKGKVPHREAKSTSPVTSVKSSSGYTSSNTEVPASFKAYDQLMSGPMKTYLDLSKCIGGEVGDQAVLVERAFKEQRIFLKMACNSHKPTGDHELADMLKPTSDKITEIQTLRESQRRSLFFNHLSTVSESIPALGWVSISPAPAPYVKTMCESGQFYSNRVLKDWKEKSKAHVEWTRAWIATLNNLQTFVKEHHTTGLVWKSRDQSKKLQAGTGHVTFGSPPPPPPPPPPPNKATTISTASSYNKTLEENTMKSLFAEINKGEDIVKRLRKVTTDMKTSKNSSFRDDPRIVPKQKIATSSSLPIGHPNLPKLHHQLQQQQQQQQQQNKPRLELEGKKWFVEHYRNNSNLSIKNPDMSQSVYVFGCDDSTLKIEGKVNNVVVDSCKKMSVIFVDVISACEFVNCQSVQMQVLGKIPSIFVDKTDGCQMYLSHQSLDVEIVSAKSSEMNVLIPSNGDFVEQPIPEQFKTVLKGTRLATTSAENSQ